MLSFSLGHMQSRCSVLLLPHRRVLLRPVGHICELIRSADTYSRRPSPEIYIIAYISYMYICTCTCVRTSHTHLCGGDVFSLYIYSSSSELSVRLVQVSIGVRETMDTCMAWSDPEFQILLFLDPAAACLLHLFEHNATRYTPYCIRNL
jgi:hypothetical protein